jgi:hypothetical protein
MAGLVKTAAQMVQWCRAEFARIYRINYDGAYNRLATWCNMDVPSDARVEFYGYYQSAGDPERWDMGDPIPEEGLDSKTWSITNYKWGKRIRWPREDRADDRTQSLLDAARGAGMKWARLPERLAYQILLGTTNNKLLPSIPNATDGGAFFVALVGGVNRFGAVDGNLKSGSTATPGAIRDGFYQCTEQTRLFQDTAGEVLWDDTYETAGFTVFHAASREEEFAKAFSQRLTLETGATAPVSNVIMDAGVKVTRVPTQRITTNDFYVYMNGAPHKPLIHQNREGIEEKIAVSDNSDSVRDFDVEYVQWRSRGSMGLGLPYQFVKFSSTD